MLKDPDTYSISIMIIVFGIIQMLEDAGRSCVTYLN